MAGEIVYADLRDLRDGSSPAQKRHAPALCPRWHGILLKVGGLGHLVLLVLVVVLSTQVFQGSPQPVMTSAPRQSDESRGWNRTDQRLISSLVGYFCESRGERAAADAGCKLCPQDWQLHRDRCYRLSEEKGNWTKGKKDCKNQKSQLVVLRDVEEKEYIKSLTGGGTQPVWIGLKSSHQEWRWVDNSPLDTETFDAPQDKGCGTLKDQELEVDTCDAEHKWVCQKEPFPLSQRTAGDGKEWDATI